MKKDSVKCMSINATAVCIPKKTLCEKLGFGNDKNLNEIMILFDDEGNDIVGLQFNFLNMSKSSEIEKEIFVKNTGLYKPKSHRIPSLIQKSRGKK